MFLRRCVPCLCVTRSVVCFGHKRRRTNENLAPAHTWYYTRPKKSHSYQVRVCACVRRGERACKREAAVIVIVWEVPMRRAIVATALSLLSSAGAFQLGPRLPVSRWVRPITTTGYLAVPSRPREAQCVVSREATCLVLLLSTRVLALFCLPR